MRGRLDRWMIESEKKERARERKREIANGILNIFHGYSCHLTTVTITITITTTTAARRLRVHQPQIKFKIAN